MKFKASLFSISALIMLNACQPQKEVDSSQNNSNPQSKKNEINASVWQLPTLTQAEKTDLIYSVQTVFNDFYIHGAQKKEDYGFDARQKANELSLDMSSETLLRNINSIYRNVNDYHTVFLYPVPARCVMGGFPMSVRFAYEEQEGTGNLKEKLVIAQKFSQMIDSTVATAADQMVYANLNPGDEILAISNLGLENGPTQTVSSIDAIRELEKVSMGANPDAAKTRAAQAFFSRNGAYMKPPSGRFELTVKSAKNRSVQTYSLPWITYQSTAEFCEDVGNTDKETTQKQLDNKSNFLKQTEGISHEIQNQLKDKSSFEQTFKSVYNADKTEENIVKSIVEYSGKKFAVVRINAFVPSAIETSFDADYLEARQKIIEEVGGLRKFLLDNEGNIEGLIFDVRDNGGGYGSFPQLITNALTTEFVPNMDVQPLVSEKNRDTFHNLEFARFFNRLGTSDPLVDKNGVVLTAPISETANEMTALLTAVFDSNANVMLSPAPRFDEDENDELPPEYTAEYKKNDSVNGAPGKYAIKEIFTHKPIAVFTNSHCYSSCDIFASLMKDFGVAKMFGEAEHTGGGGANVVEWNKFAEPIVVDAKGTEATVVPNANVLPKNIRMRFAWNRIVRERAVDQENERYIEGGGVWIPKENILKPTVRDVVTDGQDAFQTIMNDMIENRSTYPLNR